MVQNNSHVTTTTSPTTTTTTSTTTSSPLPTSTYSSDVTTSSPDTFTPSSDAFTFSSDAFTFSSDVSTPSSDVATSTAVELMTTTNPSVTNSTLIVTPANHDGAVSAGHVVAIVLFVVALLGVVACIYCYFKGKLSSRRFHIVSRFRRARTGSTSSSRHPLDEDEEDDHILDDPRPTDADLFTIGDVEENERGNKTHLGSKRHSQGTMEDDYFYDEVFGQSAFEDEVTNTAITELTLSSGEDELPDLVFKDER